MPQPRHNDDQIANSPAERLLASANGSARWERKDVLRWLKNARKRYAYWNEGCRRTGARAHEMKELYAADVDRLQQLLADRTQSYPTRRRRARISDRFRKNNNHE